MSILFNIHGAGGIDSYTKFISHMDGADNGVVFTDVSDSNHTINNTNVVTKTAVKKFGTASAYFNGSSSYLTIPDSDDWYFGAGDFTIDCWVYLNNGSTVPIYSQLADTNNNNFRIMYGFWGGKWNFFVSTTSTQIDLSVADSNQPTGEWIHVAITKSGENFRFFKNGNQIGTTQTESSSVSENTGSIRIGAARLSSTFPVVVNGYIDEFRISKSIARWTSNFTPTGPYTT